MVPGADLAGFNAACRTVGGDYYDFFPYPDGRVALALGDVSGKGMPASLHDDGAARARAGAGGRPRQPGRVHDAPEQGHLREVPEQSLHHVLLLRAGPATGELTFANAGHNPPIVVRASGAAEMLEGGGPVLGILPIAPYSEQRATWNRATCWCSTATA